jgi:flagellar motor switch protein FliN/FliY
MPSTLKKFPTLSKSLFELDQIPLLPLPPFPSEALAKRLCELFSLKNVEFSAQTFEWISQEALTKGIGSPLHVFEFTIPSIEGSFYFLISKQDILDSVSLLLSQEGNGQISQDSPFHEGFAPFVVYQALSALREVEYPPGLSIQSHLEGALCEEPALCSVVTISLNQKSFQGKLVLSQTFQKSLQKYFLQARQSGELDENRLKELDVIVHLEAGRTKLPLQQWKKIQTGDFLILDESSIDGESKKGRVLLTVDEIPFFRGKIKDGDLKILEHPLAYQQGSVMKEDISNFDEDHDFDEEEEEEYQEEELEEEQEGDEEDLEEEEEQFLEEEPAKTEKVSLVKEKKKPSKPQDIELPIVIEAGRIQMSIKAFMDLAPGNVLELDLHPERGVDLVVHGKIIGRGELLQIGETLGVRILQLHD